MSALADTGARTPPPILSPVGFADSPLTEGAKMGRNRKPLAKWVRSGLWQGRAHGGSWNRPYLSFGYRIPETAPGGLAIYCASNGVAAQSTSLCESLSKDSPTSQIGFSEAT